MSEPQIFLPGDTLPATHLPPGPKRRIGQGLLPDGDQSSYTTTLAGALSINPKKRAAEISTPTSRYTPRSGDLVIGQIRGASTDFFHVYINAYSPPAILPQLAFEGASRKTRPMLKAGDLVYARVVFSQKNMEVELSCVDPSTGKAGTDGLGPLTGGMVFDVSCGIAERMLAKEGVEVLQELGTRVVGGFEVCVGRNGRVWVDCPEAGTRGVCAIGRCLEETDRKGLDAREQKRVVMRVLQELGLG